MQYVLTYHCTSLYHQYHSYKGSDPLTTHVDSLPTTSYHKKRQPAGKKGSQTNKEHKVSFPNVCHFRIFSTEA